MPGSGRLRTIHALPERYTPEGTLGSLPVAPFLVGLSRFALDFGFGTATVLVALVAFSGC